MDIKLRARLSAYSKVSSISTQIPLPESSDSGSVLGVNESGKYELYPRVSHESIDSLFTGQLDEPRVITKNEIDTLFENTDTDTKSVSRSQIDSLFSK